MDSQRHKRPSTAQKSGDRQLEVHTSRHVVVRCHDCQSPFLEVVNGELSIQSKHGSKKHTNTLSVTQVKRLLVEMMNQQKPEPEYW